MEKDLNALPGYGKAADDKAKARKLFAEAGYGPQNPLKIEMATRNIPIYVDFASLVINELKQVGVEATLKQVDTAQWHPLATRKEYQLGANLTGIGADDPDANFYENFACGSPRNYTGYCDEQVMKMIDQQSQEIDAKKRQQMVWDIQKKLEEDGARPSTGGYVSESDKAAIMKELGIDRPIWVQYVDWLREIVTGDLGKSYRYDLPAWQVIKPLIPVTVELAVLSTLIAIALGVPTGVISAMK